MEGPQQGACELSSAVPSVCAEQVRTGQADIGIIPVAALLEQDLAIFRGTGIACRGPVRTILLISKKPFEKIEVLAVDSGSRTSVMLSRVILSREFAAAPALIVMDPHVPSMLEAADAALVIGDAALATDPDQLRARGLLVEDLGERWVQLSGLPMVFAVWAGRREFHTPRTEQIFVESCRFGLEHIDEIVAREHLRRGFTAELAKHYLTRNVVLELGDDEYRGMERFLAEARALQPAHFIQTATTQSEK